MKLICIAYLFEAVSIGTSEVDVEVGGGGGGGGNAGGGVTLTLKSSEAEKSHNLEKLLVFPLPELVVLASEDAEVVVFGAGFLLRFLAEDLGSSPRFIVSTRWAKLLARLTTSVVFVVSEEVVEASEKNNCLSDVGKSPEKKFVKSIL